MPNNLAGNPLYIDTASSSEVTGSLRIQSFHWAGGTSNAHILVLKDSNSRQVFDAAWGSTTARNTLYPEGLKTSGIQVTTIQSGRVYVNLSRVKR